MQETVLPQGHYYEGVGRRKTTIARVRIYQGTGNIVVNGQPLEHFLPRADHQATVRRTLETMDLSDKYDVSAKVSGGGVTGWAGAIVQGIARALVTEDEGMRSSLRRAGFLTRDPRVKERKKPGLKRARKAPQYTKR